VTVYLELADYLLIAEVVLGVPAELVADFNRIGLADSALAAPRAGFGGVEAYPDFETKAAVLCWHLVKNHPLPDGTSAARCWPRSSSSSATAELGSPRPVIRMRPTA
jgi:death-on-curing protein